jgi:hypothetical protein
MSEPRSAAGPTRRIGPHSYRTEGDLFVWQPRGEVLAEHARGVVAVIQDLYKLHGYVLYLLDGREGKPLGPDTRRIVVDALRPMQGALAMAAFGMGWAARASGMLVFSAARLLTGLDFSVGFFSTEAEARAYLGEYRRGRARAVSSLTE